MLWGTCRGHAQAYTRALTLTLTQSQSHLHTHMFMHSTCTHFFLPLITYAERKQKKMYAVGHQFIFTLRNIL